MRFGKLEINPKLSPGVLDTATWDGAAACASLLAIDGAYWPALVHAAQTGGPLPADPHLAPCPASFAWRQDTLLCLAGLPDGQQVFVEAGPGEHPAAGLAADPLLVESSCAGAGRLHAAFYAADAPNVDRFVRLAAGERGSRALGPVPRLGVGTRMTAAVWPAIWEAMRRRGFSTNAIQNSVRELNFLQTLVEGLPAEQNIAFGFGTIETGYTGSSYEGLWVSGALHALAHDVRGPFGADADHIQVKRGPDGLAARSASWRPPATTRSTRSTSPMCSTTPR